MATTEALGQCNGRVTAPRGFYSHQCSRKAVVERNGKGYCGQHDPQARQQKRDKQGAAYQAKWREKEAARSDLNRLLSRAHDDNLIPSEDIARIRKVYL